MQQREKSGSERRVSHVLVESKVISLSLALSEHRTQSSSSGSGGRHVGLISRGSRASPTRPPIVGARGVCKLNMSDSSMACVASHDLRDASKLAGSVDGLRVKRMCWYVWVEENVVVIMAFFVLVVIWCFF